MEILNDVIPVYIFPGFTCALQKEILYQGKLFVSENWICFHSKVFGKDTKVSIFLKTNPGGGRWEGGSGWGRHVNPRPFHFNVWQNSLQIKKKKRNAPPKKKTNPAFSYILLILIVKCSNVYKYLCHYYTFIPSFLDHSPKYYRF